MTNYTLEGTITAISCQKTENNKREETENNNVIKIKLVGLEGYAIKLGDKKYNILCEEDFPNDSNKTSAKAKIISQDIQFEIDERMKTMVTTSALSKRAKLIVNATAIEAKIETPIPITSITIFAD